MGRRAAAGNPLHRIALRRQSVLDVLRRALAEVNLLADEEIAERIASNLSGRAMTRGSAVIAQARLLGYARERFSVSLAAQKIAVRVASF